MTLPTYLNSLEIQGFRSFSHLLVPRLARLNLLVGKNSVGKTSFLEAVGMYASGEHALARVRRLLEDREEIARASGESDDSFPQWSLERIFHHVNGQPATKFCIGPADDADSTLTVQQGGVRYIDSADGRSRTRVVLNDVEDLADVGADISPALIVKIGANVERAYTFDQLTRLDNRFFVVQEREHTQQVIGQFLPAKGLHGGEPGELWDRIVLTEREDDVINALKVIDPRISRVSMIEHPRGRSGERIALVRREGASGPESLKSLGDGMSRLFELALTMTNCANNVFLVDEIENGIHHAVQADLWKFVGQLAERLNVQVFATTHSLDCIQAFQQATRTAGPSCQLIRLQRQAQGVVAEVFGGSELATIASEEIEVR